MKKQKHATTVAESPRKKKNKTKKKKKKNSKRNSGVKVDSTKKKKTSFVDLDHAKETGNYVPSSSKPFERPDTWRDVAQVPTKFIFPPPHPQTNARIHNDAHTRVKMLAIIDYMCICTCPLHVSSYRNVTPIANMLQPHVDSFNFMLGEGIQEAVKLLPRVEVPSVLPNRNVKESGDTTPERVKTLSMWIEDVKFGWPLRQGSGADDVRYIIYMNMVISIPIQAFIASFAHLATFLKLQTDRLFPSECRELGITYTAPLTGEIKYRYVFAIPLGIPYVQHCVSCPPFFQTQYSFVAVHLQSRQRSRAVR